MIEPQLYLKTVETYFEFLVDEFEFVLSEERLRGNVFYDVRYLRIDRLVSISYENVEDYLVVAILLLDDGRVPRFDDLNKVFYLEKMTTILFPQLGAEKIETNANHFANLTPLSSIEKRLLKSARELRLCIRYFERIQKLIT